MFVLTLLVLLIKLPPLARAVGGNRQESLHDGSSRDSYHTLPTPSPPSSPPHPPFASAQFADPGFLEAQGRPPQVLYPDEDHALASMAWYNARLARGSPGPSKWNTIDQTLSHPRENYYKQQAEQAKPVFTFGEHGTSSGGGRREVPTETANRRNALGRVDSKGSGRLLGSTPGRSSTPLRKGQRSNQHGLRTPDRSFRGRGTVQSERTTPALPSTPMTHTFPATPDDTDGQSSGRKYSPRRHLFQLAMPKLAAISQSQASSATPPGSQFHSGRSFSSPSFSTTSPSAMYDAPTADDFHSQPRSPRSPDAYPDYPASYTARPTTSYDPMEPAPYRMWSTEKALRSIGLSGPKLTNYDQRALSHWESTLEPMGKLDLGVQIKERIDWAQQNRRVDTRSARVMTPAGAVTGSEIAGPPQFIDNPHDPPPPINSLLPTKRDRRINAWRKLASVVPPALVGHSQDIFDQHAETDYKDIDAEFHRQVHPIQYLSQMLRDPNGAPVLENAIHGSLHRELSKTPAKVVDWLREKAAGEPNVRTKALEDLMGTKYTLHSPFWYEFHHDKPPIAIRNPLDTPLEEFAAFTPFADAVALKDHLK